MFHVGVIKVRDVPASRSWLNKKHYLKAKFMMRDFCGGGAWAPNRRPDPLRISSSALSFLIIRGHAIIDASIGNVTPCNRHIHKFVRTIALESSVNS